MKTKHWQYEIVSKKPTAYFVSPKGEILEVVVTNSDFDKYATFTLPNGEEDSYKWAYVYNTLEDAELAKKYYIDGTVDDCPYGINPWKMLLSNKNYHLYCKTKRKQYHSTNEWFVAVNNDSYSTSKKFRTFKKAGKYFDQLNHEELEFAALGENNYLDCNILEWENNQLWTINHGRKKNHKGAKMRTIKSRYLGKNETYKEWRK